MNCDEVDEILEAYALEALDLAMSRQVERHLSYCRRHDEELADLRASASILPLTLAEMAPPRELRERVLAAIDAEQRQGCAGGQHLSPGQAPRRDG